MAWPENVACPACKSPMVAHCPTRPRCRWRQCADNECGTVVDPKREQVYTPAGKRTA